MKLMIDKDKVDFGIAFREDLRKLLNQHCIDNYCNTPDYILAAFLEEILNNYTLIIAKRDFWFGFDPNKGHHIELKEFNNEG